MGNIDELLVRAEGHSQAAEHAEAIVVYDLVISALERFQDTTAPEYAAALEGRGFSKIMGPRDLPGSLADHLGAVAHGQDAIQIASSWASVCYTFRRMSRFTEAEAAGKMALATNPGDKQVEARALDMVVRLLEQDKARLGECEEYCRRALKLCDDSLEETPDDAGLIRKRADLAHRFGAVYHKMGRLAEAYGQQMSALEGFHSINNQQGISNTEANLGNIAFDQGRPELALEHYGEMAAVLDDTDPQWQQDYTLSALNRAQVHLMQGEDRQAEPLLERFRDGVVDDYHGEDGVKLLVDYSVTSHAARMYDLLDRVEQSSLQIAGMDKVRARVDTLTQVT
jgi:tetratricopeptide (TPR) repeat protein